ncbi:hypothetical protein BU17DRAFT_64118 [Hysterangium stoloniferum]|nr:hypothetical protein BU17DRAFT_64118 [Hysterangium stoloniferum]
MVSADSEKDNDNSTIEKEQKLKRRAKTKGRPHKAAVKAQPTLSDNDRTLAIFIPLRFSNGQGRLTIPFGATFSEAPHNIHEFMGCHNFARKPDLLYVLKGSPHEGINLRTEIDWEGLKQHAHLVHTKDAIINGKLLVDESQGRLADTTTSALNAHASSRKCRGKTVELPMLNLNTTAGSGGLQLDESELMSIKEKEKMRILKNRLKQCTKCGEEVYCKVNKHAVHVPLTLVQIHAWACAIAHDTHGVTLDIPPDTGAFEDFHATRAECLAKTASVPTLATGPCPMDMTNATAPFAAMMMGMASICKHDACTSSGSGPYYP